MRVIRRTLVRWVTLLALALAVAVVTGVLVGLQSYLSGSQTAADRHILAAAPAAGQAVSFRTNLATEPAAQDAAAESLLQRVFGDLPVTTHRSRSAAPIEIAGRSSGATIGVRAYEDFPAHARVIAGTWPSRGSAVVALALPESAATSLGLHLDARLTLNGTTATPARVAAIFVPIIPDDPYFFEGDSTTASPDSAVSGSDLVTLTGSVSVQWTIVVDTARLVPQNVVALREAVGGLEQAVNNDVGVSSTGVQVDGELAATLTSMAAGNAAFDSVRPIPVLLIGTVGFALLLVIVNLLTGQRRGETTVLRARGAGIVRTVTVAATEMALLAVAASAIGTGLATLAPSQQSEESPGTFWWPAVFTIATTVGAVIVLTLRQALPTARASSRRQAVLTAGPTVVIVMAAIFSLQRFRNLGSAVSTDRNHSVSVDPVAIGAPPLTLLALALVGVVLVGAVARPAAAAIAWSGKGLWLSLAARQFDRRFPAFGVTALLIGIALAGVTVAAGFDRTWDGYRQVSERLADPTEIRVTLPKVTDAGFGRVDPSAGFRGLPGVSEADDVLLTETQLGAATVGLTALPADRMDTLLPDVAGAFDRPRARQSLLGTPLGITIPAGADHLTATLTVSASTGTAGGASTPAPTPMAFVLWIAGPRGTVVPVDLGSITLTPSVSRTAVAQTTATALRTATVAVPTGRAAGWRVVGLDSMVANSDVDIRYSVSLTSLTSTGGALPAAGGTNWSIQPVQNGDYSDLAPSPGTSIGWSGNITAGTGSPLIRLMPSTAGGATAGAGAGAGSSNAAGVTPVPVVVNAQVATAFGLAVGSPLDLQLAATDRHLQAIVVLVSPSLPGSPGEPAVLADTGSVLLQLLRTSPVVPASNQVWVEATSVPVAAEAVRAVAGDAQVSVTPADPSDTLIRPVVSAFWFAAGTALLLSLLCLLAVSASFVSERRAEVVVLRAAGLSRAVLVWSRRAELVGAIVIGTIIGVLAGRLTAQATVVGLARSAVVESSLPTPHLAFAAALWWVVVSTAALAMALVLVYGLAVRRQYGAVGTRAVQR